MTAGIVNQALVGLLQHIPRPMIWHFSKRYIAGTTLADALDCVRELNDQGCRATIDVLGEDSDTLEQVEAARDLYLDALAEIDRLGLDCNVSVKLSELGLRFDSALCAQVMGELLEAASGTGNFVRIDMEDSSVTTATLDLYRELRQTFDNVGAVIQSCLHRSADDIDALLDEGAANVRLCKGIYVEPEDIAWRDPDDISESYQLLLDKMLSGGAERTAIATHDPALVEYAKAGLRRYDVPGDGYEFQMLLGVAGTLREQLVARGHPVRIYVPFGERWYPYSMRRLRENPNMMGHLIGNLFEAR